MQIDEARTTNSNALESPEPYSAAWWQQRTTTELREIIKRGFSLGPAYDGAVVETERRARETMTRLRAEAKEDDQRNAKYRLIILAVILLAILILGLLEFKS